MRGAQGPPGDSGVPGIEGEKGHTGTPGLDGPKGDKGERGPSVSIIRLKLYSKYLVVCALVSIKTFIPTSETTYSNAR